MTAPYILARTLREAHDFAQNELGLGRGHYRLVNSVGTVKAVRDVDLFLVPGWKQRYDRFAMQSALRFCKMNQIDVDEWRKQRDEAPMQTPVETPDGLEPPGIQQSIFDDFFAIAGAEGPLHVVDEPLVEEPAKTEPKRRRRRCKDCGELVEPDLVDQHAAEHLPETE